MKGRTWLHWAYAGSSLALALVFAGCSSSAGARNTPVASSRTTGASVPSNPAPTHTPTPTPNPSVTPTPSVLERYLSSKTPVPTTPTPTTNLTATQARQLVFLQVRKCAAEVASTGKTIELALSSFYSPEEERWYIEATNKDGTITFGKYKVSDITGAVTPADMTAAQILQTGVTCTDSAARLTKDPVPPQILISSLPTDTPTPSPTSTPTPVPVIGSKDDAQLGVWLAVYGCYSVFPELASFTAYSNGPGQWTVEGKSATAQYGLWQVDGLTGKITPLDQLAKQAADKCGLATTAAFPPAMTGEQAELRVWEAVYDCFDPKPKRTSFKAYVDNPQRWLVEGRDNTVAPPALYGLWKVEVTNATIAPWDNLARTTANMTACYRTP